ncbi:hypothetical protein U1E44_02290 [Arenibacter sp. GZD96]|uniref:hypothetical protein n=1 Tax=Aurantibrevibacter litoralis TaxID=3106030 RepID=UPI002AFF33B2|nr:hypothetical protein [Arenibacter sp. GZD-96]MEA1784908.1 hypothetical protein [Arenibacter sp. GZD-96]
MGKLVFLLFVFGSLHINLANAQQMDGAKLKEIIKNTSDTLVVNGNSIQFILKERPLICIYDEKANRMRIISPIVERSDIEEEQILNALVANFHSALDVKYALSDEIIWSVFTHPLLELTEHQVTDAIYQVYAASVTFGSTYTSTNLVFPGNTKKVDELPKKELMEKF